MNKLLTYALLAMCAILLLAGISVGNWALCLSALLPIALIVRRVKTLEVVGFVAFVTAVIVYLRDSFCNGAFLATPSSALLFVAMFSLMCFVPIIKNLYVRSLMWAVALLILAFASYVSSTVGIISDGKVAYLERGSWGITHTQDRSLAIQPQYSYSIIKEMLGADAIDNLEAFDDYSTLWVVTPTRPFKDSEVKRINEWVYRGGSLIVVTDHTDLFGHATVVEKLLAPYSIEIGKDCVIGEHSNDSRYLTILGSFFGMTANTLKGFGLPIISQLGYKERTDYGGRSFFSDNAVSDEDCYGLYCIAIKKRHGRGCVKVFGDSTLFADFALSRPSAQLCLRVLRDDIATINLPLLTLLIALAWLLDYGKLIVRWVPLLAMVIYLIAWTYNSCSALSKPIFVQGSEKYKTVSMHGNWDWIDADGSSLGVPFATCYSLCQGAFPEWSILPKHSGGVFLKDFDLRGLIDESAHIQPRKIEDAIKLTPSATVKDFLSDLISFSYRHDVWFNNGIGIFREAAYKNFWNSVNSQNDETIRLESAERRFCGHYYIDGVKYIAPEIVIRDIADENDFCVIGDWIVGKRVDGVILVKEKWQHHLRFYGDIVFELEKEL